MLYRVRLDLAFSALYPATDIIDKARDHLAAAIAVNPGDENEERGFILLEHCYHDETPPSPCEAIETWHA